MSKNILIILSGIAFLFSWIPFLGIILSLFTLIMTVRYIKQDGISDDKLKVSFGLSLVATVGSFFWFLVLSSIHEDEKKPKVNSKTVVNTQEQKKKEQELKKVQDKIQSEKQKLEELEKKRLAEEEKKAKEAEQAKLEEEKKKAEEVAAKAVAEEQARLQAEAEAKARQEAAQKAEQEQVQQQSIQPSTPAATGVYYKNCTEARAAGAAPIHQNEPGYARHLDRDGDGIGCDK